MLLVHSTTALYAQVIALSFPPIGPPCPGQVSSARLAWAGLCRVIYVGYMSRIVPVGLSLIITSN